MVVGAILAPVAVRADDLKNNSFTIQYDAQGIRSLKRTNDVHDTDYIQAGGSLGGAARGTTARRKTWAMPAPCARTQPSWRATPFSVSSRMAVC